MKISYEDLPIRYANFCRIHEGLYRWLALIADCFSRGKTALPPILFATASFSFLKTPLVLANCLSYPLPIANSSAGGSPSKGATLVLEEFAPTEALWFGIISFLSPSLIKLESYSPPIRMIEVDDCIFDWAASSSAYCVLSTAVSPRDSRPVEWCCLACSSSSSRKSPLIFMFEETGWSKVFAYRCPIPVLVPFYFSSLVLSRPSSSSRSGSGVHVLETLAGYSMSSSIKGIVFFLS